MSRRASAIVTEGGRLERAFWEGHHPEAAGAGFADPQQQHRQFLRNLEKDGFNWLVFVVAASGFFTDSYNLFASNVILPAIAFVYWDGPGYERALAFNLATLAASAVGQLVFGVFADVFGRRSLYGVELIIVILSTIGLLQCSPGFVEPGYNGGSDHSTWNVTVWIIIWRTVMGFGIGAEYPLSACIAAEWSSTKSRGRMMAAVFFMQPLGQLCAYGAGLTALRFFGGSKLDIDKLWRYVVGIGALPTLLALGFRLYMPESGRYTYDVRKALDPVSDDEATTAGPPHGVVSPPSDILSPDVPESTSTQFRLRDLKQYFWEESNWVYLAGTSICWLLLDFAFYGMGFNNPSTLAKLWSPRDLNFPSNVPWWLTASTAVNSTIDGLPVTNGVFPNGTIASPLIHDVLEHNMLHAIYTVSIASLLGSILIIILINHFDRKQMLTMTFIGLGFVLIVAAASFKALFHQETLHVVLILFWIVISFLFNFGPNTLTFIIPAEIFPTRYRCTCYGIAAASGKMGAFLVQIVILKIPSISKPNSTDISWLLLGFAFCMLLGGFVSHYTIPHVQTRGSKPRFVDKSLEDLPPANPRITWKGLRTAKSETHNQEDLPLRTLSHVT